MTPVENEHEILLQILKGIEAAKPIDDAAARQETWERCWSDNSTPPYFGEIIRCQGHLYRAPGGEKAFLASLLDSLLARFMPGMTLAEFGCGAGENLKPLVGRGGSVTGYDWSAAAVERVKALGFNAEQFDMFNPRAVPVEAALTVHALEQLGKNWMPFFKMLFLARPKVCIHIEPLLELYDHSNLLDYLAIQYHKKRGYLEGFLPYLRSLDGESIEIIEERRTYMGGLMHDAYSVLVWRPR